MRYNAHSPDWLKWKRTTLLNIGEDIAQVELTPFGNTDAGTFEKGI